MTRTNGEVVTAFIHAIERNDLDEALSLVTDDCEYDNVPIGKIVGPDAIRAALGPMLGACSSIEWLVHRQAESGDVVMNERLDRFEMPHGWIEVPVAGVFELRDGRIALWRDYFDEATYRRQVPGGG